MPTFTCYPSLHQNKPPRESIICGKVGNWWTKSALIMLKSLLKTRQKAIIPHTRAWATAQRTYALTTACASDCRAFNKQAKASRRQNKTAKAFFPCDTNKKRPGASLQPAPKKLESYKKIKLFICVSEIQI